VRKDIMYRGLKKKYSREEYVKLTLIKKADKCYFCLHNILNYNLSYTNKMDKAAIIYFDTLCRTCINKKNNLKASYFADNFKTLYDWDMEIIVKGVKNA